ncbi:T9SS type B sorting domain-containing protein [Chryseobacterium sp. KACC 21268]|nr:T9SS type B sorting domain-containing protein [Chryseobacterium sp. KACC 21268]
MRKIYSLVLILTSIIFFAQKKNNDYSFYENKGQIVDQNGNANPDVKYLLNSPGLNVQIKKNGFSYDVYETEKKESKKEISNNDLKSDKKRDHSNTILKHKHHRVDIKFVDSRSNPEIVSEFRSQDYENYYNLPYKKEGVSFVYRYKKLTYKNLYDNIDLVFFKPEDSTKPVEYNFLVHPGGRMSDIKMKFQGAKTKLKDGKLSMDLRFGEMQENIPNSWIENDRKQNITVNYKDFGNQTFGFESSINNSDKTIVIDPVPTRIWGSYLSGNQDIYGIVKTDIEDNVYVCGLTWSSTNIATAGAYQPTFNTTGFSDSFITKISKDGSTKLWGTYCGDKFYDEFMSVTFDPSSNVYATGMTWLPKTPTSNQYNVFKRFSLLKFNKNGTMIFSKILGGNVEEVPYDIDFKNNKLYLVGETRSTSGLATTGAFQETKIDGYTDGFIGRFDAITGDADWLTYFGGNSPTSLYQIFNSDSNYIEIMGASRASDLVMQNPIKGTNIQGKTTGLYLKFSDNGSLIYSTYLGDDSVDSDYFRYARRVGNNIFFSGRTTKSTSEQALLYKIDTNTNKLVSRKEFRIYNHLQHTSYIDRQGNIFISGMVDNSSSWLSQIGTPDAFLPNPVSYAGVYAIKYDSDLNKIWGTFYWGSQLPDIIKDSEDNLYFFGMASGYSPYVGTPGAFQETASSVYNGMYIAKFKDCSSFAQLTSNSPVCVGKPIELSANGGANYDWTGPNGFTSKEQNPKIPDASLASAGTYTCSITGTLGCDTSTSITIVVGDNLKPVPNIATLPKIIGDCKTVITSIPLATDNCTGTIAATTTDPLSYQLPGTYTITWKYDDGNGNITTQAQNVEITPQPLPIANPTQTFCKIEKRKISDISVTANNPKWYDENGILITNLSKELDDNTKYYVSQTAGGCESAKTEILIKLADPNPPTGDAVQSFCSATMPKLSNVVVNGNAIKWYNNLGVFIPNPTSTDLEDGKTYFASQTLSGCESTVRLPVKVNVVTNYLSANNYSKSICNDTTSSIKTENLDKYKKELIPNPDDYTFLITDSKGEKIIGDAELLLNENIFDVKIISGLGCYQLVKLSLTLNEKPKIDLPAEKEFCDNIGTPLDAGFNKDYSYSWNTGETTHEINADKEQTYTVQVTTPFGCTNTASVIVKKAKLAEIENILINNDTAMMLMSFVGEYLYSMDQITSQESNKFINLKNGNHTVFVKTKLGCDLGSKTFTIFSLSNIFTPNNDGVNDTWKISGIEYYPNSEVKIIDKNGITVVNHTTKGEAYEWNGESNGRKLPTDSYWYQIKLSDGRILQGYVVIKNRN